MVFQLMYCNRHRRICSYGHLTGRNFLLSVDLTTNRFGDRISHTRVSVHGVGWHRLTDSVYTHIGTHIIQTAKQDIQAGATHLTHISYKPSQYFNIWTCPSSRENMMTPVTLSQFPKPFISSADAHCIHVEPLLHLLVIEFLIQTTMPTLGKGSRLTDTNWISPEGSTSN